MNTRFLHAATFIGIFLSTAGADIDSLNISKQAYFPLGPTREVVGATVGEWSVTAVLSGAGLYVKAKSADKTAWSIFPIGGVGEELQIRDGYAYCSAMNHGVVIVDIRTPDSPSKAAHIPSKRGVSAIAVGDRHAYLCNRGGENHLVTVDISTPASPALVDSLQLLSRPRDIAIMGDRAYIAVEDSGLQIVDLTDPSDPETLSHLTLPEGAVGVAVYEDFVYVATRGGIRIVDVGDVYNPQRVGLHFESEEALDVAVYEDKLIAVNGNDPLIVYDITVPGSPTTDEITNFTQAFTVSVHETRAYLGRSDSGYLVLDLSSSSPVVDESDWFIGEARDLAMVDSLAFVTFGTGGVAVFDITESGLLSPLSSFRTNGKAEYIDIEESKACILDSRQFYVYDVSNIHYFEFRGSCSMEGICLGLEVAGDVAYVLDRESNLVLVDISDPANPSVRGSTKLTEQGVDVALSHDRQYAYVADRAAGLTVIDVSNPDNPTEKSRSSGIGFSGFVDVIDTVLYFGNHSLGINMYDITTPSSPVRVDSIPTVVSPTQVLKTEKGIVVSNERYGLSVFSDTHGTWEKTAGYNDVSWSYGSARSSYLAFGIWNGRCVVAQEDGGVSVFDLSDVPDSPVQNPTRRKTDGAGDASTVGNSLALNIRHRASVSVDIFDPSGARIKELDLGVLDKGAHVVPLSSSTISGRGIYIAKVGINGVYLTVRHLRIR